MRPDSLYNSLDNKWCIAIEKEQEIREEIFAQYFPDVSNSELYKIMDKYKGLFFMRRRRLLLLEGKVSEVVKDTHSHAKDALRLQQVSEANKKDEQELETRKPDEVYDSEGKLVTEQMNTIDVDALDGEYVTLDATKEKADKERLDKEKQDKEKANNEQVEKEENKKKGEEKRKQDEDKKK